MNTQPKFSGILRMLLSAVGAFLIGKNLFGHTIDESLLQEIIGGIMAIVSVVWSIMEKQATIESIQGAVRQIISIFGGLLAGAGIITAQAYEAILGIAVALVPLIQSWTMRIKNRQIHSGELPISKLTK